MIYVFIVVGVLLLAAFLFKWQYPPGDPRIAKVSILEYLPGGLLNDLAKDPMKFADVMRKVGEKYGPVFYMYLGPLPMLFTSVPEDYTDIFNFEVFERPKIISQLFENATPGGIAGMPRDAHRAVRRVMKQNFNISMLESFQVPMNAAVSELCEILAEAAKDIQPDGKSKVIDINETIASTTFRVIAEISFSSGMTRRDREEFTRTVTAYFEESMCEMIRFPFRQCLTFLGVRKRFFECKRKVNETCRSIIQERMSESREKREKRGTDMLDVFLNLENADETTVLSMLISFLLGGFHTTSQVLSWSLYEICCNPHVATRIEEEIDHELGHKLLDEPISLEELDKLPYIHKVWKETLRVRPTGVVVLRLAKKDHRLKGSGIMVPKGYAVAPFMGYTYMQPDIWSEPKKFKPERWGHGCVRGEGDRAPPGSFIPFGAGVRSCPGKFFAEFEGPLILAELCRRFRFSLACRPDEIATYSSFVDTPRYSTANNGVYDMGVPIRVQLRH